jgi:hypothetical protein
MDLRSVALPLLGIFSRMPARRVGGTSGLPQAPMAHQSTGVGGGLLGATALGNALRQPFGISLNRQLDSCGLYQQAGRAQVYVIMPSGDKPWFPELLDLLVDNPRVWEYGGIF